jgi:hypothetical protein
MSRCECYCDGDEIVDEGIVFGIRIVIERLKFKRNNIGKSEPYN